jgi:pSer/pThr/pTyr-binding forkhead associated (FHA) protein
MARLVIMNGKTAGKPVVLHLGINRFGRDERNDVCIPSDSLSAFHCEIELGAERLFLRDLDSTNGTFVDGHQVTEAELETGDRLRLGEVELYVESAETPVAIPAFEQVSAAAPVVTLPDGLLGCQHHPGVQATRRCTRCHKTWCERCVRRLRLTGGKMHYLCADCSFPVEILPEFIQPRKRPWYGVIRDAVRSSFARTRKL